MSDSKQKGSLASLAQKKKGVQKLKTILSQPFPRYLPKIQVEDLATIRELILNDKQEYKQPNYKKNHGIKPFSILYQIITLALTTSHPSPYILYVPNLNEILKEIFHTDSFALACKREKFIKLEEYMKIKCLEFPLPDKWLTYHGLKQNKSKQSETIKVSRKDPTDKIDFLELYVEKSHAYSSRSFHPKNTCNLRPLNFEEPQELLDDYISFSNTKSNIERELINDTTNYKTDKQNLINCIKNHLCNNLTDYKMSKGVLEGPIDQENILCKKRKAAKKIHVIESFNKKSVIQYEPLKIQKIQRNPQKKKLQPKNKKLKSIIK